MSVGIDETVAHLRRLEGARREDARRRAERLLAVVPEAARRLREDFGAKRVWLFGSLVSGDVHAATDVDLATEGLPRGGFLDAHAALMRLFPCDVDLVRIEEAPASLRERILAEGEPV